MPVSSVNRLELSSGKSSKGRRALFWGLGGLLLAGGAGAAYGSAFKVDSFCLQDEQDGFLPDGFCERNGIGEKRGIGKWGAIGGGAGLVLGALVGSRTGQEGWTPIERIGATVLPRRDGIGVLVSLRF